MAKCPPHIAQDERFMRLTLALARRGRGKTHPNPLVGAVVVKGGQVAGQGCHRRLGAAHAEVVALGKAGRAARGADLYVNLEPCCHFGRTAPCTDAIIEAGVRRVVVGMVDPNPLVNGKGIAKLRAAGVDVDVDVLHDACAALNDDFAIHITEGRPKVTLKTAVTLDGRVAARNGQSQWITGEAARTAGQRLRHEHDAVIVGVGTVLADNPRLNCRDLRSGRDPVRVVIDSHLRTPARANVVALARSSGASTVIITTRSASPRRVEVLRRAGATVVSVASRRGRVKLQAALTELARRGVVCAMLEGGPTLAGAFWAARSVDRLVAFVAPKVLGDPEGLPMLRGRPVRNMAEAAGLDRVVTRHVGQDLMIDGTVCWPDKQDG